MRAHLAGGGIILAATHGPIGLAGARELRLAPLLIGPPPCGGGLRLTRPARPSPGGSA